MNTIALENWAKDSSPSVFNRIHDQDVNIVIYERNHPSFTKEINDLLEQHIVFRSSGDVKTILKQLIQAIDPKLFKSIIADIEQLLQHFEQITAINSFRLLLTTVNTNMCRRFHTDINDIRMLCTYKGPGTLWLTEDNVNRSALHSYDDNESIVSDESKVQQLSTGDVVLLKGAIYPNSATKAVVHRSPTIEETGEKRLLLRIDTNDTSNLWT